MSTKFSVFDAFLVIEEQIRRDFAPAAAQARINELRTLRNRFLASGWKGAPFAAGAKMTAAECQKAERFLARLAVQHLLTAPQALQKAFELMQVSQSSRNNYSAKLNWFLAQAVLQPWWPQVRTVDIAKQCRPPRYVSGRRHYSDLPLTERTGQYQQYRLLEAETSAALEAQLTDIYRFLVDEVYSGRVCRWVKQRTAKTYLKDIRLMLGYLHREQGVPLDQLSLEHLVPLITNDQLDELTKRQQDDLWYQQHLYVEGWLGQYFQKIKQTNNSLSPRTKSVKLVALQRIGHYLYRHQVRQKRDYNAIPVMITLSTMVSGVMEEIKKWKRTKTTVADMVRKWPDVVEGQTALTTVRQLVVERLRLETLPRYQKATYRTAMAIAKSLQHYVKWAFVTDLPARRQYVYRTCRLALSCPLQRPDNVPLDGCYFPLPPDALREKNHDGTLADNYLCKVYAYKDKVYPEGMWILQIAADKTDDVYGIYPMEIPNRHFDDGTCFYDTLEQYLCGLWMPGKFRDRQMYSWWDTQLQGQTGHWVTKGWMEFDPKESFEAEERRQGIPWRWGYLFPLPETGYADPDDEGCAFGGSFERTSYHLIGKRITPHLLRSFWATWAFQVRLEEYEVASLAYAMGHSVKTLREIYERCTPEEKSRPIYEAINRHLFQQLEQPPAMLPVVLDPLRLVEELRQLSPEERQKVFQLANAG